MVPDPDVTVIIPTYGSQEEWEPLATRASLSVARQTLPCHYSWRHDATLADARNNAARQADSEWLIFLDADDELDERYVEAMAQAAQQEGAGGIYRPSTLGVVDGVEDERPVLIPRRSLLDGNFIVIGAMVPRELFLEVGGFQNYPISEDWALFGQMVLAGAIVVDVPDAIYRVTVRSGSRNSNERLGAKIYQEIKRQFQQHPNAARLQAVRR